jgi:hypothetical protein
MRADRSLTEHLLRAGPCGRGAAVGLAFAAAATLTGGVAAQPAPAGPELQGLPPASFPTSPHRGVIDGSGRVIPCRCRFNGKAYQLGEIVCMRTHLGTVLTRCDIFGNNTSWMPSRQPCEPDAGT